MQFIKFLRPDHLTPDMKLIAEICGMDVARKLIEELPGTRLHIPHSSRMLPAIKEYILMRAKEGASARVIARELNFSVYYVREYLRSTHSP